MGQTEKKGVKWDRMWHAFKTKEGVPALNLSSSAVANLKRLFFEHLDCEKPPASAKTQEIIKRGKGAIEDLMQRYADGERIEVVSGDTIANQAREDQEDEMNRMQNGRLLAQAEDIQAVI